jgi:hypothetical protein
MGYCCRKVWICSLVRWCGAPSVLLLVLISVLPVSAETNDGSISGQIVNKTDGMGPPTGVSVRLVTFGRKEEAPLGQRTTQSDADGRYAFSGLDRDPNLVYVPFVRYADVNYRPDELAQLHVQATWQLDIPVYESTADDRAIQLERLNVLLLGADQGMLHFMEMGALSNTGDRTFVTANPQDLALAHAIRLPQPAGALGIQMQSGFSSQDLTSGVGGVQVTSPVAPGRHEFALSFQVPYTGSGADVTLQLPYPTATYTIYLPETGVRLNSSGLTDGGSMVLGDQSYRVYRASNLPRATVVSGELSGLSSSSTPGPVGLAILSLAVVLCVLGGGAVLITRRARRPTTQRRDGRTDLAQERLDLVVQIAVLDERFAAREISYVEHQAQRRLAKQRLHELTSLEGASEIGIRSLS